MGGLTAEDAYFLAAVPERLAEEIVHVQGRAERPTLPSGMSAPGEIDLGVELGDLE
ncbi:hypothetical protein [Demequina litorisediminis]|uniref:Uncharacterized protein n=1 Tax=Demequina litorisediminis TaxID=1849022 RepID=A0ABQ6IIF8_9MICO|nr:hypothetical protein [Demequina litorisediminis]GMA36928.1 hypothetical protein GCM10025876_31320 [Demequina litorisediminis]